VQPSTVRRRGPAQRRLTRNRFRYCVLVRRAWLVTTNDNLDALRFYQRRSWRLVQVNRDAVDFASVLKPLIPKIGAYAIEIHDEIELEYALAPHS
jgi:hypothetical protein